MAIGGIKATVSFSGLAPGYAGLYQLNIQVPASASLSDLTPVTLTIGNASDTAYMAVQ